MGGAVDVIQDIGSSIGDAVSSGYDAVENAVSDINDWVQPIYQPIEQAVSSGYDSAVNFVEESIDLAEQLVDDPLRAPEILWKEAVVPFVDTVAEATYDVFDVTFRAIDYAFEAVGVKGSMAFFYDFNMAVKYIQQQGIRGDETAIMYGVALIASIALTVWTLGGASGTLAGTIGAITGLAAGAFTATETVVVVGWLAIQLGTIVSSLYGIYSMVRVGSAGAAGVGGNMAMMYQIIRRRGGFKTFIKSIEQGVTTSRGQVVAASINGTKGMWMPGGIFYDAPRAGDLQFKADGNLNTTVFLGLPNINQSRIAKYQSGYIGDYVENRFSNMAGSIDYSPRPMVAA